VEKIKKTGVKILRNDKLVLKEGKIYVPKEGKFEVRDYLASL